MERLWKAFLNSARAWRRLMASEAAFRQEVAVFAVGLPAGWFLATSWTQYAALIISLLFLMVVEVLNTGIEATCDALSREFNADIQLAKDCGSLAVLLAITIAAIVWGMAAFERLFG